MAEDALFAFIPGYPVRRVSRRPAVVSPSSLGPFGPRLTETMHEDGVVSRRYVVKNIPMEMVVAGTDSASISLKFTSTAFSWSHVTVAPSS